MHLVLRNGALHSSDKRNKYRKQYKTRAYLLNNFLTNSQIFTYGVLEANARLKVCLLAIHGLTFLSQLLGCNRLRNLLQPSFHQDSSNLYLMARFENSLVISFERCKRVCVQFLREKPTTISFFPELRSSSTICYFYGSCIIEIDRNVNFNWQLFRRK